MKTHTYRKECAFVKLYKDFKQTFLNLFNNNLNENNNQTT